MKQPGIEVVTLRGPMPEAPADIVALAEDSAARNKAFQAHPDKIQIPAFVPSNALIVYRALALIVKNGLATGPRFCEWGSGLGTVTCLAASLGLSACGIEIEARLVAEARNLAQKHGLSAEFHLGSYKPEGIHQESVDARQLGGQLGFSPVDFDIIFVYPWPAEERAVNYLFREFGRPGGLLVVYYGGVRYEIFRKPLSHGVFLSDF